ncbi:MAG: hypothetical protein ABI318_07660 [Chthoniobacteraceae bacterium]
MIKELTTGKGCLGCIGLFICICIVGTLFDKCTGDKVEGNQYYEAGKNFGKGISESMRIVQSRGHISTDRLNADMLEGAARASCPAELSGEAREQWVKGYKAGY